MGDQVAIGSEVYGKNILFDTGANSRILLKNMEKAEIRTLYPDRFVEGGVGKIIQI